MKKIVTILSFICFTSSFLKSQTYTLDFDGTNDHVYVGDVLGFEYDESFTIEAWVKTSASNSLQQIISKLDASFRGWGLQVNNGKLNGYLISTFNSNNTFVEGTTSIDDGLWHHVAMVNNAGDINLYVDGNLESTFIIGTVTETILNQGAVTIGCYDAEGNPGEFWEGNIDDLRIWKTSRSESEIQANMNQCLNGDETNLTAFYNFNDGPNSSVLSDLALNSHDGNLNNMNTTTDWVLDQNSSHIATHTACDSFTWIDGNTYTSDNNSATVLLMSSSGCDSLITLDLNITSVDPSISTSDQSITATESGALYQWLDCDNNYEPIDGEINQTFNALTSGNYAVEINKNGCIDTSNCVNVTVIVASIKDQTLLGEVSISPNPNNGLINIDLRALTNTSINIFNISGQLVYQEENVSNRTHQIDLSNQISGLYFLELASNGERQFYKLVKE